MPADVVEQCPAFTIVRGIVADAATRSLTIANLAVISTMRPTGAAAMTDFSVEATARKWCLRTRSKYHTPNCRICEAITAAIREALEEAEKIALRVCDLAAPDTQRYRVGVWIAAAIAELRRIKEDAN